jgi:hypothetical protein
MYLASIMLDDVLWRHDISYTLKKCVSCMLIRFIGTLRIRRAVMSVSFEFCYLTTLLLKFSYSKTTCDIPTVSKLLRIRAMAFFIFAPIF